MHPNTSFYSSFHFQCHADDSLRNMSHAHFRLNIESNFVTDVIAMINEAYDICRQKCNHFVITHAVYLVCKSFYYVFFLVFVHDLATASAPAHCTHVSMCVCVRETEIECHSVTRQCVHSRWPCTTEPSQTFCTAHETDIMFYAIDSGISEQFACPNMKENRRSQSCSYNASLTDKIFTASRFAAGMCEFRYY